MNIIPLKVIELESAENPDDLLEKISNRCALTETDPLALVGSVNGNGFRFSECFSGRKIFYPVAIGRVIPNGSGSLIKLRLQPTGLVMTGIIIIPFIYFFDFVVEKPLFQLILLPGLYFMIQLCFWMEVSSMEGLLKNLAAPVAKRPLAKHPPEA
jgi:hypothetical protein